MRVETTANKSERKANQPEIPLALKTQAKKVNKSAKKNVRIKISTPKKMARKRISTWALFIFSSVRLNLASKDFG